MIEQKYINANESGLSVRSKLNKMFRDLISGVDGSNNLWKRLNEVNNALGANINDTSSLRDDLQNRILDSFGYTDREIGHLLSYVNGMKGGVNGFADSVNFIPKYPKEVAATVIGVGPGIFKNMIGEDGRPISITTLSVVIFFKAENSIYWNYKTIIPNIVYNETTGEFGESTTKVVTQKFFTDVVKNIAAGEISDLSVLDSYYTSDKCGLYVLKNEGNVSGHLLITGSPTSYYQVLFGDFEVGETGIERSSSGYKVLLRSKEYSFSWSDWQILLGNNDHATIEHVANEIKGGVIGAVDVTELDTRWTSDIDDLKDIVYGEVPVVYRVFQNNRVMGLLGTFSDSGAHGISQIFITNGIAPDFSAHTDGIFYLYKRVYGRGGSYEDKGKWTEWEEMTASSKQSGLMSPSDKDKLDSIKQEVLSEDDYNALIASGDIDEGTMYFIYE